MTFIWHSKLGEVISSDGNLNSDCLQWEGGVACEGEQD